MRTSDAFPSQFLKKEDVGDRRVKVTIDRVEMQDVQNGDHKETKPVVYFRGVEKGLVLNKGNAEAIQEAAGGEEEMDNWGGVVVLIYVDRNVTFAGKRVGGLRISPANTKPQAPAKSMAGFESGEHPADDDIPF